MKFKNLVYFFKFQKSICHSKLPISGILYCKTAILLKQGKNHRVKISETIKRVFM